MRSSHNEDIVSVADQKIRLYLKNYSKLINEIDGCGTLLCKVHWMLHYIYYCKKFGSFLNFNGGIGERHLKSLVKEPARKTQRRQPLLAAQAMQRNFERTTIDSMYTLLENKDEVGNQLRVTLDKVTNQEQPLSEEKLKVGKSEATKLKPEPSHGMERRSSKDGLSKSRPQDMMLTFDLSSESSSEGTCSVFIDIS